MNKPTTKTLSKKNSHHKKPSDSTESTTSREATAPTPRLAAEAYSAILAEIEALPETSVRPIKVDIPHAVSIALGATAAIAELRPAILKALPKHPMEPLDRLQQYALGAWYAHLLALPTTGDATTVARLLEEAAPLREGLLVAAEALAHRKVLDPATVAQIRSGQGNLDTANDLVALATVFTTRWADVAGKTAVTQREVERAAELGPELLVALGEREQAPARTTGAAALVADRRARAFTLLVDAYDACRRAVTYLRWNEGDADAIAPSLFKLRSPRRATGAEDPAAPPPDAPPAPTLPAAPPAPPAPTAPTAAPNGSPHA